MTGEKAKDRRSASAKRVRGRRSEDPMDAAHHVVEQEVHEGEVTAPDPDQKGEPGSKV